jgi:ATP adenylyltransferase
MPTLHAPWRMDYIRNISGSSPDPSCFICQAAAATDQKELAERLVLWSTPHSIVVINRFPYTNGHLLIAPRAHKSELQDLTPDELLDLNVQTSAAIVLLKKAISPQGFNIGINLGRVAGAGLPGHLHQHLVPRWNGDTNFMSVVGEVRVVPEAMSQMYKELTKVRDELQK